MNKQNTLNLPDAYQFFDNSFGNVVPFEKIREDSDSYASVFCEGSVALRNLLLTLWDNGVETRGCCKGHERVHYYVKESIWGDRKYIDEQTYRAHISSKRYHDIISDAHPYIAFRPEHLGNAQDICNQIEVAMKELYEDVPYVTNAYPDIVTIGLDSYVDKDLRECFFETLSFVLKRDFFHDKCIPIETASHSLKESLSSQIHNASSRAESSYRYDLDRVKDSCSIGEVHVKEER